MIVITLGEISGIGPEVVLKAIGRFSPSQVQIIGSKYVLEKTKKRLKIKVDYKPYLLELIAFPRAQAKTDFEFGRPDENTGWVAFQSLRLAVEMIKQGKAKGIVTAPISKENIWRSGFKFPGQTEFLAQEFGIENYCLLAYHQDIKVAFLTQHVPIKKIPSLINSNSVIEKGILLYDFLSRFEGVKSPRIGIFSLNPHGEEFSAGEEKRIKEGVKKLLDLRISVAGPLPACSFLWYHKKYDGFISPYHDQGMIMVKTISCGRGINTTLGLPFVRTSPLHGTALDIAGKGIADARGMEAAIQKCLKWTQ